VLLDRPNVGGSESALQPLVIRRGDPGTGATWTLDGMDVSDPAVPGASALYLHPFLLYRVTAEDGLHVRTGGVPVVMTTRHLRRGGSAFLRYLPSALESDNVSPDLRATSLQVSRTRYLAEGGARVNARLGEDLYVGAGATWSQHVQQAFTEHDETQRLTSAFARLDAHVYGTHTSLTLVRAEKIDDERDTTFTTEPEARWRQSGPVYVAAGRVDRVLSVNSTLTLQGGYLDSTFDLEPLGGRNADAFEDFRGVFQGSYLWMHSKRRRLQASADWLRTWRRWLFEVYAGYRRMPVATQSGWPGNQVQAFEREQVFFRTFRLTGFAIPTRNQDVRSVQDQWEGCALATYSGPSVKARVGVRVDRLSGRNEAVHVGANALVPEILPALDFPGSPARFRWLDVLPRLEVQAAPPNAPWRWTARYAEYAGPLGSGDVTFDNPVRDVASISYYWRDANDDHVVQANEIEVARGRLGSSGIDPEHPASTTSVHQIDPDLRAPRTHEGSLAFDASHGSLRSGVLAYYRRNDRLLWRPLQGLTLADYAIRGAVRGTLYGEDYSVGYYAPASSSKIAPGNGRILTNREGYHQDVFGIELSLSGRRRDLWWRVWGAATDWRERFDDTSLAVQDPTSTDSEPGRDAGTFAVRAGGFGRDVFVNARWNGGALVNSPLPAHLAGALLLRARDGFPIPYFQAANAGDPTAGSKNVLVASALDRYRLPPLVQVDAQLSRAWRRGGRRVMATADVFNVLNSGTTLQVNRDVEQPSVGEAGEILRPRMVRLGVTVEF
jgi:hypothetical protein